MIPTREKVFVNANNSRLIIYDDRQVIISTYYMKTSKRKRRHLDYNYCFVFGYIKRYVIVVSENVDRLLILRNENVLFLKLSKDAISPVIFSATNAVISTAV